MLFKVLDGPKLANHYLQGPAKHALPQLTTATSPGAVPFAFAELDRKTTCTAQVNSLPCLALCRSACTTDLHFTPCTKRQDFAAGCSHLQGSNKRLRAVQADRGPMTCRPPWQSARFALHQSAHNRVLLSRLHETRPFRGIKLVMRAMWLSLSWVPANTAEALLKYCRSTAEVPRLDPTPSQQLCQRQKPFPHCSLAFSSDSLRTSRFAERRGEAALPTTIWQASRL